MLLLEIDVRVVSMSFVSLEWLQTDGNSARKESFNMNIKYGSCDKTRELSMGDRCTICICMESSCFVDFKGFVLICLSISEDKLSFDILYSILLSRYFSC